MMQAEQQSKPEPLLLSGKPAQITEAGGKPVATSAAGQLAGIGAGAGIGSQAASPTAAPPTTTADPTLQLAAQLADAQRQARDLAALVELIDRMEAATDPDTCCQVLANELKRYLNAGYVAVGLCPLDTSVGLGTKFRQQPGSVQVSGTTCKLTAAADQPGLDLTAETTRLAEAVLQECVARGTTSVWPTSDPANRHALLVHQQFAVQHRATGLVGTALRDAAGRVVGAVFVSFGGSESSTSLPASGSSASGVTADSARPAAELPAKLLAASRFLTAAERSLATSLLLMTRSSTSLMSLSGQAVRRLLQIPRLRTAVLIAGIVATVLLLPVQYKVTGDSELQPAERRYVAAPFDGPLLECFVQPGDYVDSDQLLARMDGREIHWEQAGLKADLNRATNERNTRLAGHEFGDAEIARHEVQRLQNRSELLAHRNDNLEIRSPVGGMIISGDHKEAEGVPLETGQTLFEIAALDRMIIEVAVPEEDIRWVQPGQSLQLSLNAMPSTSVQATVLRIHPRAELRDSENVFIAEAEIDNSQLHLRPGMRGYASVETGRRPLGWNLFHKPVAHVIGWFGW